MNLTLLGASAFCGVYCGLMATHAFGLMDSDTFAICIALTGIFYAVAEGTD